MIKQYSSESDWQEIWDSACKKHPLSEILELKEKTESVIANSCDKYTIVGYSGGKDSLVLRHMVENCLKDPVFINCELENEFPSFMKWLYDTAPKNTVFVKDHSLTLEFLDANLSYLFPHDPKEKNTFVCAFHQPTYSFMRKNGYTKFLTGKRKDDGNFCGKKDGIGMNSTYSSATKVLSLNPMADWKHDHLLAYIQYFGIELPGIYYYPNGFRFGTHPWTERRRLNMSYYDTFDEIMGLEPEVLYKARDRMKIVRSYFDYKANGGEKK